MKHALYVLQCVKRHLPVWLNQSRTVKKIMSVALAIIELILFKGTVSQSKIIVLKFCRNSFRLYRRHFWAWLYLTNTAEVVVRLVFR